MKEIIEKHLVPRHRFIYGFADMRGMLPEKYKSFSYGISIARKLDDNIVDELQDGPTLRYLQHYKEVNVQLSEITGKICDSLKMKNIISLPVVPTIAIGSEQYREYLASLSYEISHKMIATRAGLGWIGKTDLLVTKEFGPRVRLVSILLEKNPGNPGEPVEKSRCGKCNICVLKCPAKAATGLNWDITIHRDVFFNAFNCREKCAELAWRLLNVNERICGLCVSVCPIGRR
ncbi:MAG TPA: hypothetical protein VK213_11515 [Bacteroidales bacterium]|nr:hypothetical protein [Bacteroidales bacterium]